jgi:2-polyprenyl-3-methyl-5-hydroxy-6-metoxy-1,4-benzoquinol methylase
MVNWKKRSYKKELLDADGIPTNDIQQNLRELNTINAQLGGHRITLTGIRSFIPFLDKKSLTICEIGCGGGDNLYAIHKWLDAHNISATFIGIDIKESCTSYAHEQYPDLPASWITDDFANVSFGDTKPDIVFCSLFCHHFAESDLIKTIQWMNTNSYAGFFINDLHRHPVAYHSIKWLTRFFSKSYLVKNDAPLSVLRGFLKKEWIKIFSSAGILNYSIKWKWAFRHLIICRHEG